MSVRINSHSRPDIFGRHGEQMESHGVFVDFSADRDISLCFVDIGGGLGEDAPEEFFDVSESIEQPVQVKLEGHGLSLTVTWAADDFRGSQIHSCNPAVFFETAVKADSSNAGKRLKDISKLFDQPGQPCGTRVPTILAWLPGFHLLHEMLNDEMRVAQGDDSRGESKLRCVFLDTRSRAFELAPSDLPVEVTRSCVSCCTPSIDPGLRNALAITLKMSGSD